MWSGDERHRSIGRYGVPEQSISCASHRSFSPAPQGTAGSSFLSTGPQTSASFRVWWATCTAFRRLRQFPTTSASKRPCVRASRSSSRTHGAGDPMLPWANYKIIEPSRFLASVSIIGMARIPIAETPTHGGRRAPRSSITARVGAGSHVLQTKESHWLPAQFLR